jgi:hypothetical protein
VDELIEYYPEAKVILTTRDVDSWQKSVEKSIFKIVKMRILPFMSVIDPVGFQDLYPRLIATNFDVR